MSDKLERVNRFLEKYKNNENSCNICPRACGVDRNTETGDCGEPFLPRIASANLHTGEEPPISGQRGSGTIFFAGCNLHCVFCQNFPISQLHQANRQLSIQELAETMLSLEERGAHNINFVTPSHYVYQLISALKLALRQGFNLPVVYNTSGYDSLEVVRDLDGIIDVYLPDAKYCENSLALKLSDAAGYTGVNRKALKEMFRQAGEGLLLDDSGIARKGMIIRHLVLPGETENSKNVLKWIAEELSPKIHLSLMSQYFPAYRVTSEPQLNPYNRRLDSSEYNEVADYAESLGFENGWFQEA